MLTLLILSAAAQAPAPPPSAKPLTPQAVARVLASAGYAVEATNANGTEGTATRDRMAVRFDLSLPGFPKPDGTVASYAKMGIVGEIPVGEDPPRCKIHRVYVYRGDHFYLSAAPHLGRTATLWAEVYLEQEWSAKSVRRQLDRFWSEGAAYARRHGGAFVAAPERDWSKARFADSLVLDEGDMVSLARAMDAWGFRRTGAIWRPGDWPRQDYVVAGETISVYAYPSGNGSNGNSFALTCDLRLASPQADEWIKARGGRKGKLSYEAVDSDSVVAMRYVELQEGVTLGDLRRDVLEFAADVATLPRTVSTIP